MAQPHHRQLIRASIHMYGCDCEGSAGAVGGEG